MTDFFDRIEGELRAAAVRQGAGLAGARPRRRGRIAAWFASHSALALAGGVVVVGGAGATAAVVAIHGQPSAPPRGVVPSVPHDRAGHALRYRITMTPQLQVGSAGWCQSIDLYRSTKPRGFGGIGCGDAPRPSRHVFTGSTTFLGTGRGVLVTSVVDRTVAYGVLTSGKRIVPVDDPRLPNGWRLIVVLPGESHDGKIHYRDATGASIRAHARGGEYTGRQRRGASKGAVPSDAPCTISVPAGADARSSHWLLQPRSVGAVAGDAFLPCAQTALRVDDAWAEVTVLLDAAAPGDRDPAAITAGRPSPTDPALVEFPATGAFYFPANFRAGQTFHGPVDAGARASAQRAGKAWLVVRAKSRALRERLLQELVVRAPG